MADAEAGGGATEKSVGPLQLLCSLQVRAENTYLLALDGDVDFQPEAIIKLVDLMKRNPDVGAACGRIHPTGSGAEVIRIRCGSHQDHQVCKSSVSGV